MQAAHGGGAWRRPLSLPRAIHSASTVRRGLPAFPLRRPAAACPLFRFDGPLRPVAFRKTSKFVDIGRIPAICLQFL